MTLQIIVCDDEPHIVRAISLKFTRAGFDVKGASDAESCWKLLHRNQPPALLIVDDTLPSGPNAIELVRRIRSDVQLAHLPVILLTEKSLELIERQGLLADLNIAQITAKPFSPRELLATACRLVDHDSCESSTVLTPKMFHLKAQGRERSERTLGTRQ